jgi:hypothetical protein
MGRPPIGRRAMTGAERQRRRRRRLKKLRDSEWHRRDRMKRRQKNAERHPSIPMPPGITYWEQVVVRLPDGGSGRVWAPRTKPLAACGGHLEPEEIRFLLRGLIGLAQARGLDVAAIYAEADGKGAAPAGGVGVCAAGPTGAGVDLLATSPTWTAVT